MTDLEKSTSRFFEWWNKVLTEAPLTAVGKIMTASGYDIAHTGGGCLAWNKNRDNGSYQYICTVSNALGETVEANYLVGVYDAEGEIIAQGEVKGLQAALDWMQLSDRDKLTAEYAEWCAEHDLPKMSADELLCELQAAAEELSHYVRAEQASRERMNWLKDFSARWELMQKQDD